MGVTELIFSSFMYSKAYGADLCNAPHKNNLSIQTNLDAELWYSQYVLNIENLHTTISYHLY